MPNTQNNPAAQTKAQRPLESIPAYWARRAAEQALADTQNMADCLFVNGGLTFTEYVLLTLDIQIAMDNLEVR